MSYRGGHEEEDREQRHQQHQHPAIRLPRLQIMDEGSNASMSHRHRSTSGGSQSGMAAFAPWSPGSEHPSAASGGSQSGISSPTTSLPPLHGPSRSQPFSASTSPKFPLLPAPTRRSTMMEGSLPPLSATMSSSASLGAGASRIRSSSGSAAHLLNRSPMLPSYSHSTAPQHPPAAPSMSYSTSPSTSAATPRGMPTAAAFSPPETAAIERKPAKAHVSSACLNCKRAHLACDAERPCRRCTKLGKTATCVDVQHKKRGRPRLKDREMPPASSASQDPIAGPAGWSPAHAEGSMPPSASLYHPSSTPQGWGQAGHHDAARPRSYTAAAPMSSYPPSSYRSPPSSLHSAYGPPQPQPQPQRRGERTIATLLCGTDLVAAHVSYESQTIFGLPPDQVRQRSAVELVHPADHQRFEAAWARLVHPVEIAPVEFPALGEEIMRSEPTRLLEPARGTIFVEETIRMRLAGNLWAPCSVRFYLGGAFGLDLYRPETKDRAFIVTSIYPLAAGELATASTSSSSSASTSHHPNFEMLRSVEFPPTSHWSQSTFKTPSTNPSPYMQHSTSMPSWSERSWGGERAWDDAQPPPLARRTSIKRGMPADFDHHEQLPARRPSYISAHSDVRPRLAALNISAPDRDTTQVLATTPSPVERGAMPPPPAGGPSPRSAANGRSAMADVHHPFSSFPSSASFAHDIPHHQRPAGSSNVNTNGSLRHPPLSNARDLASATSSSPSRLPPTPSSTPAASTHGARGLAAVAATKSRVTTGSAPAAATTTVGGGGGSVGALAC
ncbi:hypothetical protein BDZ90DRAFT_32715 [Jaminaea rosea]|uniref:Transcription activator of gluconeogenesis ERT1 n=1 Tax=Jaminaea rosea TaxID=1569628 RepID=A0A316V0I7_9BASI|nr:hypothetical protein BDZ90DRAFT_32715 [Jaminaea rosea]PWN31060.1 hypothetical protein BDZ90DRAFT_32715 [Jaminaea rosea]